MKSGQEYVRHWLLVFVSGIIMFVVDYSQTGAAVVSCCSNLTNFGSVACEMAVDDPLPSKAILDRAPPEKFGPWLMVWT